MKTFLSIIGVAILGVGVGFLVSRFFVKEPKEYPLVVSEVFSPESFRKATGSGKYVMMVVGEKGCGACNAFVQSVQPQIDHLPVTTYYLDVEHHPDNKILANAFNITGFPSVYVIDPQGNLIAMVDSLRSVEHKLDSIIVKKLPTNQPTVFTYDEKINPKVFDNTLRAVLASMEGNLADKYKYAHASLALRPYCYNNYLLHEYFTQAGQPDSAEYYRQQTLAQFRSKLDVMVNSEILRKLEPSDPRLAIYDSLMGI